MSRLAFVALLARGAAGVAVPFAVCEGAADALGVTGLVLSPARLDGGVTRVFARALTTAALTLRPAVDVANGTTVELAIDAGFLGTVYSEVQARAPARS